MDYGDITGLGTLLPLPSDFSISGQAQGDILYFDGTNWVRLPPGTAGQRLETQGAGADPTWENEQSNLTGDVTSVGLTTTTVTNANLTGDVTSVGNAATIPSDTITVAMLADGTDGELITWDAAGGAATVAVGTAGDVLTSGGVGVAPTFVTPAGGEGLSNVIFSWRGRDDKATTTRGLYHDEHTDLTSNPPIATDIGMLYHYNRITETAGFQPVWPSGSKWKKIASISTLTWAVRAWKTHNNSSASSFTIRGDCGGQTGTVAVPSAANAIVPNWRSEFTVDVSSLSDGTTFDLSIDIDPTGSPGTIGFAISGIVIFGS